MAADNSVDIRTIDEACDRESRIIWMDGEVNDAWVEKAKQIIRWNQEDQGLLPIQRVPIKLFFFSPGGSADVGRMLVDVILSSVTPVYAVNIGVCASAAALIYLACERRSALKRSGFMLHKGSFSELSGELGTVNRYIDKCNADIAQDIEYIAERTKITKAKIEKMMAGDWYFTAQEALSSGICQSIVTDWVGAFDEVK